MTIIPKGFAPKLTAKGPATAIPVSVLGALGRGVYELDDKLFYNFDGKTTFAGDLSGARALRGAHNHQNLAAALAVCANLGLSPAVVIRTAERFAGLPHRMEEVSRIGKVSFVNDSKATNAEATGARAKRRRRYFLDCRRQEQKMAALLNCAKRWSMSAAFI